jgi:adenine/guanine/hypoxanthine permease
MAMSFMRNYLLSGNPVSPEIIAGITTFLTASYIIFVNPAILSQAGMDRNALISVTCFASAIGTLLMAFWPRVPIMMAPGMGLNAYFTYSVVKAAGISWQTALGIVFLSGVLFFILTIAGLREKIIQAVPHTLRMSIPVGIGLFIAFIGLKQIGLIQSHSETLVTIGKMNSIQVLLGLLGLLLIGLFELRKTKGSILLGILIITIMAAMIGLIDFPKHIISLPPSIAPLAFKMDIMNALQIAYLPIIFSFMYVALFDSLGTLVAISYQAGFVDKKGNIPGLGKMLMADALGAIAGSALGTSTVTAYIESGSGVAAGGKTGFTSLVVAILFIISSFLAPLIAIVPSFAVAPALIIVGIFMIRHINEIDFKSFDLALPSFLTIIIMPLTYSIANGLCFGFISYFLLKLFSRQFKDITITLIIIVILSLLHLITVST